MNLDKDPDCPQCNSNKIKECNDNYCHECINCGLVFALI
jgi:hypothetical protein